MSEVLQADLAWTGDRFERDVPIVLGDDGRIEAVGGDARPTRTFDGCAILPGMVNAHSHAFQRGLRGRGETFESGRGSFWSWREAMYGLVSEMTAERLYDLSKQAFTEMLAAGITTVGEFHYLHHDESEKGYAFDAVVLRAAADAGIRIVLLNAFYAAGGIGQPLSGGQKRFETKSLDEYWAQMDRLVELLQPNQSLGVVAHSIRAVPIETIVALREEAHRRHLVFHMHVEEQPAEIAQCLEAYSCPPMKLLNERLVINPRFTAVHCTHTAESDLDDFLAAGGNVCICPLTEANLGDGVPNLPRMLRESGRVALGTDSNARISFQEEMRWLEYVQRLFGQCRGVCVDEHGRVGRRLWQIATQNGARSLGVRTGSIRPAHAADLIVVDLDHPALAGWDEDSLLDAIVLGAGPGIVRGVCVGGRWVIDGH